MKNRQKWKEKVSQLDFAFQPIVNIHSGLCFGYEALLRGYDTIGYHSIHEFFDDLYEKQILYQVDLWLRKKAIKKFLKLEHYQKVKLFYNLDNRVIEMDDYSMGNTLKVLAKYQLNKSSFCFELSERHEFKSYTKTKKILDNYTGQGFKIAIDDYGMGFSGLQLFYHSEPDFIKIDKFFIQNISTDSRKRLFVSNIVNMAHALGITVIAEGIETEAEFYTCKELACDLIQGYLIQKPCTDLSLLQIKYKQVETLNKKNRRDLIIDRKIIYEQIEFLKPISIYSDMLIVFDYFKKNKDSYIIPILNHHDEPIGIIKDQSLKDYAYSLFGVDLVRKKHIEAFVTKCPKADINTSAEKILELFSYDGKSEGIIITKNEKYIGFLTPQSLLKVLNAKNIAIARDQNPLTRLPGNHVITEYMNQALKCGTNPHIFVYFDLDNFKPFNDCYGFRNGDRVILLFSEILTQKASGLMENSFVGHIGGDDFFLGIEVLNGNLNESYEVIRSIIKQFADDVYSFYSPEDRKQKSIISKDREGNIQTFPLLSVSGAVLTMPFNHQIISVEELSNIIAEIKKDAKKSKGTSTIVSLISLKENKHSKIQMVQ